MISNYHSNSSVYRLALKIISFLAFSLISSSCGPEKNNREDILKKGRELAISVFSEINEQAKCEIISITEEPAAANVHVFFMDLISPKYGWTWFKPDVAYMDINQYINSAQAQHVITHETGHIFGLDHTPNPDYQVMNEKLYEALPLKTAVKQLLAMLQAEEINPCLTKLSIYFSKEEHNEFE